MLFAKHRYNFNFFGFKKSNLIGGDSPKEVKKFKKSLNLGAWPRLPLRGTSGQAQLELLIARL